MADEIIVHKGFPRVRRKGFILVNGTKKSGFTYYTKRFRTKDAANLARKNESFFKGKKFRVVKSYLTKAGYLKF